MVFDFDKILAQGVGVAAMCMSLYAVASSSRDRLMALGAFSAVVWSGHYALIGLKATAVLQLLSAVRIVCAIWAYERGGRARDVLCVTWLALMVAGNYMTVEGGAATLFALASSMNVIASFYLADIRMRLVMLASDFVWIGFGYVARSWPSMAISCMSACINGWTLYKLTKAHAVSAAPTGMVLADKTAPAIGCSAAAAKPLGRRMEHAQETSR